MSASVSADTSQTNPQQKTRKLTPLVEEAELGLVVVNLSLPRGFAGEAPMQWGLDLPAAGAGLVPVVRFVLSA